MADVFETLDNVNLSSPKTVTINGSTVELSEEAEKQLRESYATPLVKELEQKKALVKTILSQTVKECQDKEAKADAALRASFPVPDLSYLTNNNIVFGVHKDSDGKSVLRFILPFRYAPVSIDKKRILDPKQLRRDIKVIIDITGATDKRVENVVLVNQDLSKFEHYHNFDFGDCLGELADKHRVITNFTDLLQFRDVLQVLYSDIHVDADGDRNHKYPAGLPGLFSIKTSDETVTWKQKQVRLRPSTVTGSASLAAPYQDAIWHVAQTRVMGQARRTWPLALLRWSWLLVPCAVVIMYVVLFSFFNSASSDTASPPATPVVTPVSNRAGWSVSGNEATVSGTVSSTSSNQGVTTVNFTNGTIFSMRTAGYYDQLAKPLVVGNSYVIKLYGVPGGDNIQFHSFIDVSPMPGSTPVHPEIPGYKWVGE